MILDLFKDFFVDREEGRSIVRAQEWRRVEIVSCPARLLIEFSKAWEEEGRFPSWRGTKAPL